jgi:hypothetical protein
MKKQKTSKMKSKKNPPNSKKSKTKNTPSIGLSLDKNVLKKALLEVTFGSRKKKKDLWLQEITKYDDLIKEAYFNGAPKLKIIKALRGLGFQIPHNIFQAYFEKQVVPINKRVKRTSSVASVKSHLGLEIPNEGSASNIKTEETKIAGLKLEEPSATSIKSTNPPGSRRKRKPGEFRVAGDDL